jgi:hypothetical protein
MEAKPARKAGRPRESTARKHRVLVQFNDLELAEYNRLTDLRRGDLAQENVSVNGQDLVRWLIVKELRERDAARADARTKTTSATENH